MDNTKKTADKAAEGDAGKTKPGAPTISLPKGGGAIRGIGEKFAANPVTGTGSMSIPIFTSPGRSGFHPQLSLSYDSGAGNGPFGFGWHLSVPKITRKTDKGLPRYQDAEESDVFILSDAEDLVPVYRQDQATGNFVRDAKGNLVYDEDERDGYNVRRYRPRIEGLFARIELWRNLAMGETHWRAITKDNVTSIYGDTPNSRIADPADDKRVFSWLLARTYDDKGNVVVYRYAEENDKNVAAALHEDNRQITANRYLQRIFYGHQTPYDAAKPPPEDWHFQVVFDYGEHDRNIPQVDDDERSAWASRPDPFSGYRAGFEVRTYRRCRRVLMFHRFAELGEASCLVRSTDFTYKEQDDPQPSSSLVASFITSVTQCGYVRQGDGYMKRSFPPVEFEYRPVAVDENVRTVDQASLENLPIGLDGTHYQWVDLDGEGLSGILTEQGHAWFYKRNLSPLPVLGPDGKPEVVAQFAPMERVGKLPWPADLNGGHQQFMDLAGDGQLDLVDFSGPVPGYFERTDDADWESLVPFTSLPNVPWKDPNLKFVDLTGDGHADILITEDNAFTWYPSLAEAGFGPAERAPQAPDEERGPRLVFADGTQSVYLADMSGDGLNDLVRIRNGEICYWPNLGYGRFGAKITMSDAPLFDYPDQFDQKRLRLADIDGSGNTDLIYLGRDVIRLYFNRSGNSWSPPQELKRFPAVDNLAAVTAVDLLGNGTACLVWSSPLPGDGRSPMRYIDLMGGQKPHLLIGMKNNLGAETLVQYAPSTKFYLADKRAGKPWITRLPFPVHVVERVDTLDYVSRNRFVACYAYHHGYFDGVEREFRGFGLVEEWDTEEYAALSKSDVLPDATNIQEDSHVPPVWTKTWFHTGAYLGGRRISTQFEDEYYREYDLSAGVEGLSPEQLRAMKEQLRAMLLDDTTLPETLLLPEGGRIPWTLSAEDQREACRALKGSILRQEIYALDKTDEAERPYSVSERNYTIEMLQPHGANRHAVFFAHPRETVYYHYERKLFKVVGDTLADPQALSSEAKDYADPRVTHTVNLAVDGYGNILQTIAIGYGRRFNDPELTPADQEKQQTPLVTYTENRYTNAVREPNNYRAPLPCETRTFEVVNIQPPSGPRNITNLCRFGKLQELIETKDFSQGNWDLPCHDVEHKQATDDHLYRRVIEHACTLYRKNDLTGPLPLGQVKSLALPYDRYMLAFTPELLAQVYRRGPENLLPDPASVLGGKKGDQGGYVDLDGDGHWWIPSGRLFYEPNRNATPQQELTEARQHFFLPRRFRDPFDNETIVAYDNHDLLIVRTTDAVNNTVETRNDYRVLQPAVVTDPNGNRSAVAFDALGLVVGTAVMGKPVENLGDTLDGFASDLTPAQTDGFYEAADPHVPALPLLQGATTRLIYDLERFQRTQQAHPDDPSQWLPVYAATLARETHNSDPLPLDGLKVQISFAYSDGFGREIQKKIQAELGPLVEGGPTVSPRWVGSGWTIFNNKGKPVRQYEPFFSQLPAKRHHFEFGVRVGVSPILFYDPVERVVATLHPNHTYEKVVFDPWRQETWDVNDTVLQADAEDDPDVGDFFRRLPGDDCLPTWYAARQEGQKGPEEQAAAQKTAVHANTPTVAHLDTLGRVFLTVAHNRFEREDSSGETITGDEKYLTRAAVDIEGNQRAVRDAVVQNGDALGRLVMRYDYDLLSNCIHQASMEAGERWMLNDVAGKPLYAWDSRGHQVRTAYDALRRPTESYLRQGAGPELLVERTVYGETRPNPEASNLRGKVVQLFDQAGVVTSDDYDFKGNLRCSQRQLAQEYKKILDWSGAMPLEAQTYANRTRYDALNRPTELTTPDNSVIHPTYNEANLLEQVQANLRGVATATLFIANIDYNAKGQRTLIEYGNGASTSYAYDPDTFRLIHLRTTRRLPSLGSRLLGLLGRQPAPHPETVQDLSYTYDPAGNITHIGDDAQQTIYFRNQRVEPSADYTYDAMYRLIEAKGREHLGQTGGQPNPPTAPDAFNAFHTRCDHPGDGKAMGTYSERYVYDAVGNILEMQHRGSDPAHPGWTRSYSYHEASLIEPTRQSNRLSQTTVGNNNPPVERYVHDAHGNMIRMPHLGGAHPAPNMYWDYKDELRQADLGGGGTAYYVYDAAGQRVRKVWEKSAGLTEERIYLSGFEVFRRRSGAGAVRLQRETLHVMDDKQRIALVETRTQGDEPAPQQLIRYQISNHLGSASLELDDDGQIISYEEYYPYGSTSYQAVRNQTETPKRYRYTGKERDEESGLEYHLARYYLPWLGRWVSADPAGFDGGINLYEYCRSNPIRWVDLGGKEPNDYPQQMPSSGVLIPNTSPPLSTSSGTPKPNPIDSKTSPNVYAIPSPPQRQGASFGSTLLSILFFPLIALSGCSSSAPKPGGTVTGSHVIIAGATSVNDPGGHDKKGPTGGWNYLNAAANRTKDIKKNDPTAKVTVIMYSPENLGYQKRGVDEGKGKYHFENLMRDSAKRNGFELIIIRKADQLTPMLNTAKDGQIKQLEYFGHSDQNNFLLEYSSDIPRGSTDYWGKNDIAGVRKGIFAAGGKVNLYGCNLGAPGGLGQEMKHKWGLKVTAADTRTDYVPLTGSAWKPSGHYIEMK